MQSFYFTLLISKKSNMTEFETILKGEMSKESNKLFENIFVHMSVKLGINGFGRIGRLVLRAAFENKQPVRIMLSSG